MSRIFLGNFDFEHELAISTGRRAERHSASGRAAMADSDRSWAWISIAETADLVLTESEIDQVDFLPLAELGLPIPSFIYASDQTRFGSGTLVPWGWTDSVRTLAQEHGWDCTGPPIDVVRQVNSRAFRYEFEREWKIGLEEAAAASSLDELESILRRHGSAPRGWLLKANFGMSGREARRGRGAMLDENTRNWAVRRLASAGPIVFEPIVERVSETGIQIDIPQTGEPILVGVTPLLVDASGVYRGSRFALPTSELEVWRPAVECALRLAHKLQRLGYFGPLGVDAMKYRDGNGEIRLRQLQDLNARYTMGRLALGLCRIVPAGWCGSWLHLGAKQLGGRTIDAWIDDVRRLSPAEARFERASPRRIAQGLPLHHAVVVLAPDAETLKLCESILFASLGLVLDSPGNVQSIGKLKPKQSVDPPAG